MYMPARAAARPRNLAGLGDSSFDWNALLQNVTGAAATIYSAQSAADIAKAQAQQQTALIQAQQAQQAAAQQAALMSPIYNAATGTTASGGVSMGLILLLAALGIGAVLIMRD